MISIKQFTYINKDNLKVNIVIIFYIIAFIILKKIIIKFEMFTKM